MSIELKPHNEETYIKVKEKFQTSNKVAVIHPTGTGKMYIALKMLEDNKEKKAIYIAPSNSILHDLKKNIFAEGMNMSDFPNLKRITYQKLARLSNEEIQNLDFDIIVLDEFHHCGAPEWGKGVERLIQKCPDANVLGLSATPLRYFDGLRDMSDEIFDNNVASEMTLEEAIKQGILPEAIYVSTLYGYDAEIENIQENINKIKDKEKREQAQELFDILSERLDENTRNLPELFMEYMKNKSGKWIVFCRNIEDMQEKMEQARNMFGRVNSNITIRGVSSQIRENEQILTDFENDNDENSLKLLYAVDMLNEGYHIKDLDGVIMMRPTLSPTIFTQQLGRGLTVGDNKIPVVLDLVNNFSTCKIIEDFTERMKAYKGKTGTRLPRDETKSRISIFDKTKEFMEIVKKITELSKRNKISLEEKIQIFEKFNTTGEELTGDTIFEGYPIGKWAIQIRASIKRQNTGKNQRAEINPTEEQLDRLNTLGILDRQIEATIDEKIEMLVEWMKKYPQAEIKRNIPEGILRGYATTEEEYLSIIAQYQNMQRYYLYIRQRKNDGKLTEEQISKCKEGNVRGIFGYPTVVEELVKKTGVSEREISDIINNYGTMEHFIQSYKSKEQDDLQSIEIRNLASSMLRNTIDIDLNPNSKGYDALYSDIMHIEQTDNTLELYSSEKLKEQLETLLPREKYIIERRYGLLSDELSRDLKSVGSTMKLTENRIRQIQIKALRKLGFSYKAKQFRYTFDKSDVLTEDECKTIDELKNNLYASDLIFRNNPHISPNDAKNEDIIKAFELIKNMREITEEREEQQWQEKLEKLNTPLEDTNISVKAYMYLQKRGLKLIGDINLLSPEDNVNLLELLGKQAYIEFLKEIAQYGELNTDIKHLEEMPEEEIAEKLRQREEKPKKALEQTIEELGFSIRTFNVLKRAGIETLGDISKLTEEQFSRIRNTGKKMYDEVAKKLGEYGLTFREDKELEDIKKGGASENESQATHEAGNEDTFIEDVLENATRRVEVRKQNEQAEELAKKYEEVFGKRASNDGQPFNNDGNR